MTLPDGQTLVDVRAAAQPSPYTTYDVDIAENFEKVESNLNQQQNQLNYLQQADIGLAADAINNIPNLIVNGSFLTALCSPNDESGATTPVIPLSNPAGIKQVRWADCWFVDEDSVDALDVQSVEIDVPPSAGLWFDPENGIRIKRGTGSGTHTGVIFQRIDLHTDLRNLRGKSITIGVNYTAMSDNEFHIEVDDGVTVSDNSSVAPPHAPLGTNTSRHIHVVDSAATKLTLRIVLDVEAPVADADALVINQVYARPGASPINLPVNEGASPTPRDLYVAAMYSRYFIWGENGTQVFAVAGAVQGGVDTYQTALPLDIPIINDGSNTQVGTFSVSGAGYLTDVLSLAVPPALTLTDLRPPSVNREIGDSQTDRGLYYAAHLALTRTPDILPDFGFTATRMGVGVSVIPDP